MVADPDLYAPALAYQSRDAELEIDLIDLTRKQIASILQATPADRYSRVGVHNRDGLVSLEQIFAKAVSHLRHHVEFILEKRRALGMPVS
jgi:hypothetical protein